MDPLSGVLSSWEIEDISYAVYADVSSSTLTLLN